MEPQLRNSLIHRVGQNHTFIGIYGVYTVFLAGNSPYIRSYTVQIYGSGQPYLYTKGTRTRISHTPAYSYHFHNVRTRGFGSPQVHTQHMHIRTQHKYQVRTQHKYKYARSTSIEYARSTSIRTQHMHTHTAHAYARITCLQTYVYVQG